MLSEAELIKEFLTPLTGQNSGALNLTDDVAILACGEDEDLIISKDLCIAGKHFFKTDNPADIAFKAVAVNVSDIISKGADPTAYLLGLALPDAPTREWAAEFTSGLKEAQAQFGLDLLGGDTTASQNDLCISITVFGKCLKNSAIRRSTANYTDHIYVTGTLGDSALGFRLHRASEFKENFDLEDSDEEFLISRYMRPSPRINAFPLVSRFASSAMDLSDGLVSDLQNLCEASNCGADINLSKLPFSKPAQNIIRTVPEITDEIISWGDDYEIILTIPEKNDQKFNAAANIIDLPVHKIGCIKEKKLGIRYLCETGEAVELKAKQFQHF